MAFWPFFRVIKDHFNDILTQIFNLDINLRRNLRKHICNSTQTIWSRRFEIAPLSRTTNGAAKGYKGCHKKNPIGFDCMNDRKVKEDKNLTCLWRCPSLRQNVFG